MKIELRDSQQSLIQWASQATGLGSFGVKIRLKGNDLHILCEGLQCPQRWQTLHDLLRAIQQTDLDLLTSCDHPSIYQVFVYGRQKVERLPEWCHRVYLNQLDRHLEEVEQILLKKSGKLVEPGGALILSNESLARQGQPDAIARYLSETLSIIGVSVRVNVKKQEFTSLEVNNPGRVWVFCQSAYTPDRSLVAESVAEKLRSLKLVGYKDALVASQVSGETNPDWLLRVDLTPKEQMLKQWARWGDLQAIARLLTIALSPLRVSLQVSVKECTLHIFCTQLSDNSSESSLIPDKATCLEVMNQNLQAIAPQGLLAATVYGQKTSDEAPAWIDWLTLPANEHPALAESALELATAGDEPALVFLLERLLNPDLDLRLKTGGIRVLLLRKKDLLHIMCDAPICPTRKEIALPMTNFVRQLKITGISGLRIYCRRAGEKEPVWNYGVNFEERERLVPEPAPEFAANSAHVDELVSPSKSTDESILHQEITTGDVQNFVSEVARDWFVTARKFLLETQLFIPSDQSSAQTHHKQVKRVVLVWGTLGLLLTLQIDWVLGQIISRIISPAPIVATGSSITKSHTPGFSTNTMLAKSPVAKNSRFNGSKFTGKTISKPENATPTAILLAARSAIPTFNERQLDEQLALYKQRLAKKGSPPDVLIIGSSRALRGVDPEELSRALALQGHRNIDVFNFGINGATAQVEDFIIRQLLQPKELPKLIIWADGSRAFNSGRPDTTFKAIASSPGYRQVLEQARENSSSPDIQISTQTPAQEKTNSENHDDNGYKAVNKSLNKFLGGFSATYENRDFLKSLLNEQLKSLPVIGGNSQVVHPISDAEESTPEQFVDFNGFLSLPIRFHPAKYYQKHPRVSGSYDKDYESFRLEGDQDLALKDLVQFANYHHIPVVLVNMPLSAYYLDPIRAKYEQDFQQYMLSLSTNSNFIFRDLTHAWPQANDLFSDPSHLNQYGAYEISKKLAIDPMIPWPRK